MATRSKLIQGIARETGATRNQVTSLLDRFWVECFERAMDHHDNYFILPHFGTFHARPAYGRYASARLRIKMRREDEIRNWLARSPRRIGSWKEKPPRVTSQGSGNATPTEDPQTVGEKVRVLKQLLDDACISQADFDRSKDALLGRLTGATAPARPSTPSLPSVKRRLAKTLASHLGLSYAKADTVLRAFFLHFFKALEHDGVVLWSGMGSVTTTLQRARSFRSPASGDHVNVPPRTVYRFRPYRSFTDRF